jgi:signal transduction histidine kinase/CheY-like chemotaxis protein/HPt (histidine-containing phosphotransfer) domain-containing protein
MMGKDKQRKYAKYFLSCIALYLATVGGYSCWYAHHAECRIYEQVDSRLLLAAQGLGGMLAEDYQDRAVDADSIPFAEEMHARRVMNRLSKDSGFKYVYTIVERDGKFYFSATAVTEKEAQERKRWYFYPYSDIPPEFMDAYRTGKPAYVSYEDTWGVFRSIALPQTSPGGRRYLSCADMEISFVNAMVWKEYLKATITALFFVLPMVPMILVYRRYNSELMSVNEELRRYQGHLEELVTKRTTELERAKDLAEQASRLKSRFVFNISHEIRTPMNGVIGFCEAILDSETPDDIHGYARTILREAEVLLALINDLLDMAKIEAGRMELDIHAFDLWGLLEEIASVTDIRARQKELVFQIDMSEQTPRYIRGDSLRLRQILVNLISNSLKFTEKGSITLAVACSEDADRQKCRLKFSVIDTGIGIPKEKQGRIFQSFTQADVSTTRKYGGTGLGTSIAQQLVGLMGGSIKIESEANKGSTFWFEINLETTTAAQLRSEMSAGAAAPVSLDHQVGNILVADDYPTNQQIMKLFLEQDGQNLVMVSNGLEAVKACTGRKFDLIFMDLQMPEMDGKGATQRIRQDADSLNKDVPIIALTASGEASMQQECLQVGMSDFLVKPIRRDVLLSVVDRWLSAVQLAKQEKPAAKPMSKEADSGPKPIDLQVVIDEFEEKSLVEELLIEFLRMTKTQLHSISEAIEQRNFETITHESHCLRGGADTLAAGGLAKLAEQLEYQSREQKPEKMAETFIAIEQEFGRVKHEIEEYIA